MMERSRPERPDHGGNTRPVCVGDEVRPALLPLGQRRKEV